MESSTNNTTRQLAIGETWSGVSEFRDNTVTIAVNLITTKNCVVFVQQSTDNINFVFDDQYAHEISIIGTESRFQVPAKARFYRVKVENVSGEVIPQIIVTTYFLDVNKDSTLEQPAIIAGDVIVLNAIQAKDYEFNTLRDVSCDNTGHLLVNINGPTTSTGDLIINGSSSSATRPVYLMVVNTWYRVASVGNTPGHVWTSIGAIVGSETVPTVGRLFKCLSVPSNIQGQGEVYDVEYSDTVTATPVGTQDVNIVSTITVPVSGSVALLPAVDPTLTLGTVRLTDSYGAGVAATAGNLMVGINNIYTVNPLHTIVDSGSLALLPAVDPTLTLGTVRLTDTYGSPVITSSGNLMIGINNIYTTNPLHTILDSGSVSVTGSVAVTNADITSIKTNTARFGLAIGSNYEESVINTFTNLSITGGYLYNLNVYSAGTIGINFLKVYGVAGATIADTPLLIVPVPAGQSVNLSLSGLKALTGISVRATTTWAIAGNTSPSNPISCNLTFSPLV